MTSPGFSTATDRLALSGRAALVTGGASGIGRATAALLSARGARVAVLDVDETALDGLAEAFAAKDVRLHAVRCDITSEEGVRTAIADCASALGGLDILVNNVGTGARVPTMDLDTDTWSRVIDVNLTAAFVCAREFARRTEAARGGAIVNVASIMGAAGNTLYPNAAYHASKGGMVNLTRALAAEWAPHNIRVNAVLPTFVETELTRKLLSEGTMRQDILDRTPMNRLASPEDVAEATAFLVSDAAAMITGALLPVDGGWLAI